MAAARLILAGGMTLLAAVGLTSGAPVRAEADSAIGAALASAVGGDCEVDASGGDGQCESSLSLRQLRGELREAVIRKDSRAAGAQHGHEAGVDGGEGIHENCEAASEYCGDIETYLLQEDCAADSLCRVIDMGDHFHALGGVPKGEAWLCAPSDKKCDRNFSREEFQSVDEVPQEYEGLSLSQEFQSVDEVPQEYEGLTNSKAAALISAPLCTASRCGFYDPSAPCQCNRHCSTYGNCCPNYKGVCESGNGGHAGTCAGRSCYNYVARASCQCNELCKHYGNCCHDYQTACSASHRPSGHGNWSSPGIGAGGRTMTLYHTTSLKVARLIIHSGFRPGKSGWCGGAIYFINHPQLPRSKYAPGITKDGAILEAKVEMGRMATGFNNKCQGYGGTGVSAAKHAGFNSMRFNPGDGDEYIVWNPQQVLSIRIYQEKLTR